ncbi:MAG: hypothetical protein N3F66_08990 [Spirochaetes bacterium]|nr:hypothetical protein [Spirochaetota bacterium]
MPLRHVCILLFVCIAAVNAAAQPEDNPYSFTAIAGFANHCVEQKEYYRAYQEYHRLHVYYPDLYPYNSFFIASLYCRYQGRMYQPLLDTITSESLTKPAVWLFAFDSAFNINAPVLNTIIKLSPAIESDNAEYKSMVLKRKLAYLLATVDNYDELSPYTALTDNFDLKRISEYSRFTHKRLKDPYVALGLGLVPGAGYIYSGSTENGIIAAIVIGACAAITWLAADTGNVAIAVFTGAAGTFFYGGSMVGGYMAAKKENSHILKELYAYLEEELKFEQDREMIFNRYGKPKTQ